MFGRARLKSYGARPNKKVNDDLFPKNDECNLIPRYARKLDAVNRGKLNVSKWAKITSTSTDTALLDIKDLVERGILVQEGNGRNTSYKIIQV